MNIVDMADPISMWVNCKGRAGVGVEMQLLSEPVSRFSGVNNAFPSSLPIATLAKFQGNRGTGTGVTEVSHARRDARFPSS